MFRLPRNPVIQISPCARPRLLVYADKLYYCITPGYYMTGVIHHIILY